MSTTSPSTEQPTTKSGSVQRSAAVANTPLLQVDNVSKEFPGPSAGLFRGRKVVSAVAGVTFSLAAGETVGIVGESGCGKSTLARLVIKLINRTGGDVLVNGESVDTINKATLRRTIQMVFQDPYASLNPRMTIGEILAEPYWVHQHKRPREVRGEVSELLEVVGLSPEHASRYPHEFSGGQRQRVGIARALAVDPSLIVLDEPVSALDVSIQAGIVNLLRRLQRERELGYLFIAHDLAVVRHISDRVGVMYLGKLVELGTRDQVYGNTRHPYTVALMSAAPVANPAIQRERKRMMLTGEVPSPIDPPSGCRFRTRCWKAQDICASQEPSLTADADGHAVACHFPETAVSIGT